MITDEGKRHIKRYLAEMVPSIGQSIAFGIGDKAVQAGDIAPQFEIGRVNVSISSYDFDNDRVIFKGSIPAEFGGVINEVALFSTPANTAAGQYGSQTLASFDSVSEDWEGGYFLAAPQTRLGTDSLALEPTPETGGMWDSRLINIYLDLSGNSGQDLFSLAFYVADANCDFVEVRFETDVDNYYTMFIDNPSAGYNIVSRTKGSLGSTGSPTWESINGVHIFVKANDTTSTSVYLDGLRIEDTDTINPNYVMVARSVLDTPYVKEEGIAEDIEFSLAVTL